MYVFSMINDTSPEQKKVFEQSDSGVGHVCEHGSDDIFGVSVDDALGSSQETNSTQVFGLRENPTCDVNDKTKIHEQCDE